MNTPQSNFPELELMRSGIEFRFKIKIRSYSVLVRPLSNIEIVRIAREVSDEISGSQNKTQIEETILLATKTLEVASTSDIGANDPKLTSLLIARLSASEIDSLYKQYQAGCERCNPDINEISVEEVERLVAEVKKNRDLVFSLTELSLTDLVSISAYLIRRESPLAS